MPVLDWTRTQLAMPLPGGATALRFNAHEYAAFDCFMLARKGAEADHAPDILAGAKTWFDRASQTDKDTLLATIMAGLPGAYDRYDIPGLRGMLDRYADITADGLRENSARFLREVIPAAEEAGVPCVSTRTIRRARCSASPHRLHRRRHRVPVGRGRQRCERPHAVHGLAGAGAA